MQGLYRDILLDHYKNPRNAGEIEYASFSAGEYNPSCGDAVIVSGKICDAVMVAVKCKATGCVITVASASLLSELVLTKSLDFIITLDKKALLERLGIPLGPTRLRCALFPFYALKDGIAIYQAKREDKKILENSHQTL